jgi:hypothetical protein
VEVHGQIEALREVRRDFLVGGRCRGKRHRVDQQQEPAAVHERVIERGHRAEPEPAQDARLAERPTAFAEVIGQGAFLEPVPPRRERTRVAGRQHRVEFRQFLGRRDGRHRRGVVRGPGQAAAHQPDERLHQGLGVLGNTDLDRGSPASLRKRLHAHADRPGSAPAQKRARDADRARASRALAGGTQGDGRQVPAAWPDGLPVRVQRRLEALRGFAQRGVAGQPSQRLLILVHKAPIGYLEL